MHLQSSWMLVGGVREQQHDPEITKHLCQIFSQDTVETISKTREKQRCYISWEGEKQYWKLVWLPGNEASYCVFVLQPTKFRISAPSGTRWKIDSFWGQIQIRLWKAVSRNETCLNWSAKSLNMPPSTSRQPPIFHWATNNWCFPVFCFRVVECSSVLFFQDLYAQPFPDWDFSWFSPLDVVASYIYVWMHRQHVCKDLLK